jgi:hypothetical protein
VLVAAPVLARHWGNLNVRGFVNGAYAAAKFPLLQLTWVMVK